MRSKCILCGNGKKSGVPLFGFPKDERKQEWLTFCNVDCVLPSSTLCKTHFKAEYISKRKNTTGRVFLKRNAVPTQNRRIVSSEELNVSQRSKNTENSVGDLRVFLYRLSLSVAFTIRKFKDKYQSLSIEFDNYDIEGFNDIVFRNEENSIHVKIIANVDKGYKNNDITCPILFGRNKEGFIINTHFNSFVNYLPSKLDENNLKYLIIYTNTSLELTKENELKNHSCIKSFYPFKFDTIEDCGILKDLFVLGSTSNFYQFSKDQTIKEELYKRLTFSPSLKRAIKYTKYMKYSENEIKDMFVDKLVFAVNQPNREELNYVIKKEIDNTPYNYTNLREAILCHITASEKYETYENILEMLYNVNLLVLLSHTMFLHKSINSINCEIEKNEISILHENRIVYIKIYDSDDYDQFPINGNISKFFNNYFNFFTKELKSNVKYFIIYTNFDLGKIEGILKLDKVDTNTERYQVLRYFPKIGDFYQFSDETTIELISNSLKIPYCFKKRAEKEGKLSIEFEKNTKDKFMRSLIFVTNQPNRKNLQNIIRDEINASNVPYSYEDIYEIISRWIESNQTPLTKETIERFLNDINNNVPSFTHEIQNRDEEIRFAKTVAETDMSVSFDIFLNYLIKEEKLSILKKNGINPMTMSHILQGSCTNSLESFEKLYDLWFDDKGHKTKYLITLEKEGIKLSTFSKILHRSKANAATAFKDLYEILFDEFGNKTKYLKFLEKYGIKLCNISSILGGFDGYGSKIFREFFDLFLDENGTRSETCYLKSLDVENVRISNMVNILHDSGFNEVKNFEELYRLWFNEDGSKTLYLKTLEKEEMILSNMFNILSGVGTDAAKAFKALYDLWFDEFGYKTHYLKTLEKEEINLRNISSILGGAGSNAAKAFKELHEAFFDGDGNKTPYLMHFINKCKEYKCFTIHNISSILSGAGAEAKRAFEKLHNVLFNEQGKRTDLLVDFNKAGFKPSNLSGLLCQAGNQAPLMLRKLYNILFDEQRESTNVWKDFSNAGFSVRALCRILSGASDDVEKFHHFCFVEETKIYLNHFLKDEKSFKPGDLSKILHGAGSKIYGALKEFHDVCYDEIGNRSEILNNFDEIGFSPRDLSNILSLAGNNASAILWNFHELCFNKENYLNHFLAEQIFTSKDLSKILDGAGVNTCPMFEKLHNICFDQTGRKRKYLKEIARDEKSEVVNKLYEKIRTSSFSVEHDL